MYLLSFPSKLIFYKTKNKKIKCVCLPLVFLFKHFDLHKGKLKSQNWSKEAFFLKLKNKNWNLSKVNNG